MLSICRQQLCWQLRCSGGGGHNAGAGLDSVRFCSLSCLRVLGPHECRVFVQRLDLDGLLRGVVGVVELLIDGSQVQLAVKFFGLPSM